MSVRRVNCVYARERGLLYLPAIKKNDGMIGRKLIEGRMGHRNRNSTGIQ